MQNWSIPHGECSAVGVAGWLLNGGTHAVLNFRRMYHDDYVREIRAVTMRGSIIRILGARLIVESLSPHDQPPGTHCSLSN